MKFSTQKRRTSRERFDLRPNVISAFTVATQHGQPINFASAPIKTHIAPPFGERAGAVSKNERDDFFPKSRIIFKKKKNYTRSSLSGWFSCWFVSVGKSWDSRGCRAEKLDRQTRPPKVISRDSFCQRLYCHDDSSEGVLTWDAMTLSAFQKYDRTLARRTAPGEFSACLHRWRSCCECH